MRIVHVSDCYAPRTGGIETQVRALALAQSAEGHDVEIVTATPGHDGVFAGDDVVDGLSVHRIAMHLPFELPVHPRTGHEVGRLVDAEPPDVVHVHAGVVSPFAWSAIRATTKRRVPTLATVHSVWGPIATPGFGAADALLRWHRWGAQLSAVSATAAHRIASAAPRAGEVLIVPNGIDPDDWQVEPAGGDDRHLRVASVLRMAPRKRTGALVRVLAAAAEELGDDVVLTAQLVGDGPERARAERFVRDAGLADRIGFTGRLERLQIIEVFAASDTYVQPSVKESFGLAALEARTAGLPVVIRSQSGSTQFVRDGVEGLVADDDDGLTAALVRLGREPLLRTRIAEHNTATPPAEAWPSVLTAVFDAYDRAQRRVSVRATDTLRKWRG